MGTKFSVKAKVDESLGSWFTQLRLYMYTNTALYLASVLTQVPVDQNCVEVVEIRIIPSQ